MELSFKPIQDAEIEAVSGLIMNMYEQHLKRYYTEKGNEIFTKNASIAEIKKRSQNNGNIYLVKEGNDFVGVVEFDKSQLSQFFIVDQFRGRGYGRMTINWLKKHFKENNLGTKILVEASPNAYLAFEKVGFEAVGEESSSDLLICKKMALSVDM